MKHQLTLHYGINNCGDGSASITLFESAKLADWDQDHQNEGWGERCSGSINLESDSPITIKEKIETKEGYLADLLFRYRFDIEEDEDEILECADVADFIAEFFPDGKPRFAVIIPVGEFNKSKYGYNDVYIVSPEGVPQKITRILAAASQSGEQLEKILNR